MSNCVTINGLQNLPQEQTLLIHYVVTCTGTWYLSQYSTAYRNVCDDEWTVMFPNHQHPLHSDFPLVVTSPPLSAVFAWNYGGIQGISAESFDESHSYLVQIGLFNYDCYNTGQTITGEPTGVSGTTGNPVTGSSTGIYTPARIPPIPGPPVGGGSPPTPTHVPPFPVPGGETGFSGKPPVYAVPPSPSGSSPGGPGTLPIPQSIPNGGVIGGSGSGEQSLPVYSVPTSIPVYSGVGSQQPIFSVPVDVTTYNQNYTISYVRPSLSEPGQTSNPNLNFSINGVSEAIINNSTTVGQPGANPDLNAVNLFPEANIPGYLSSSLIDNSNQQGSSISNQYRTSNLESSALIDLQVSSRDVIIGEPIVISAVFRPQVSIRSRMEITVQDNSKQILVSRTNLIDVSRARPLTSGISIKSSTFNLGKLVVTCKVLDESNKLIAIKSIAVNNIQSSLDGTNYTSKVTLGEDIPEAIINASSYKLSLDKIPLTLESNKSKYVIFSGNQNYDKFSALLQVDRADAQFSMSVYTPSGTTFEAPQAIELDATYILSEAEAYSTSRFKINNQEVYPETHNVALTDVTITPKSYVSVEISPAINHTFENCKGILYMSENFKLRPAFATGTTGDLFAFLPYGMETYGLILHGRKRGIVPDDYSIRSATANPIGEVSWYGLSLTSGDYYSIVQARNGVLNPFAPPILVGRYQ